ncbi:glycoside hydrolase family 18 protein [Phlebiopsis gigantea 11061_1 CR5-6]|uniref:Glycoside hydrolase family 18 protein n=1 Tax=Phlebiopsis gigantea (strain 11061_1 CR5-6) TaxID=745531 RepID=A0A0C3S818_PHLG1|nr:glycoside hydrolase family 18 protein [Phlebiopsis gigantea 11061_1 CR5-6]
MISSSSTRATFISSVGSTLAQYGLDGIDIDFEYPGAVERNAPATDTPNLTAFFSELRSSLPSTIISVAAPAGYWFLKGFEIDKIASSVTYINMMSYDYHGPWDTNVTDQAPVTNPHTSILDMQDSALLYVRAGIDLSIGPCSDASGILTQFEILALMQQQGLSATLDTPSETYWFDDKNGDLVTFDQANTWAAKQKFAKNACFGGSFVWYVWRRSMAHVSEM